eukprot:3283558-Pleurochrysis_carterae.AAC.2
MKGTMRFSNRSGATTAAVARRRRAILSATVPSSAVVVSMSSAFVGSAWGQVSRSISSWSVPLSMFACGGGGRLGGRCICVGVGDFDWAVVANPGNSVSMERACGDM